MYENDFLNEWNLNLLGIRDLRKLAFGLGVFSYTRYNKAQLVQHILAVALGKEPPLSSIGRGRPSSINLTRKEAYSTIINKIKTKEVASSQNALHLVASSDSNYYTGEKEPKVPISKPTEPLILANKKNMPINVFAPLAFGSRVLIYGEQKDIAFSRELVLGDLKGQNTILLLANENPEDIDDLSRFGKKTFSSTFDDSQAQTIQTTKAAFGLADKMAQENKNPIVVISSLCKLAKAFDIGTIDSAAKGQNISNEAIITLTKVCLLAHARPDGKNITLIAFAENDSNVDKIIAEHLKAAFTTQIALDNLAGNLEDMFPLDVKKSNSKYASNFQHSQFAKKQKEIRTLLLNGELSNLEALKKC